MARHAGLEWRCRRGTRELDLLLLTWLVEEFDHASHSDQQAFLQLLDWPDDQLTRLLLGQAVSINTAVNTLAGKIRALSLSRS